MNWSPLQTLEQLQSITAESKEKPVLIFKHSRTCSISRATLDRLERNWKDETGAKLYFLDLLTYREISNRIASDFGVVHESPQVLIIKDGKSVFDRSHFAIEYPAIASTLQTLSTKN